MFRFRKYARFLVIPLLILTLTLMGCSSGSSAGADTAPTARTPFDQLKDRVATLESDIVTVKNDVKNLSAVNTETLEADLATLQADFDSLVNAFDLMQASIQDDVDELTAQLDTLTLRVDELEQEEPDEDSTLALTIVGSLPDIVKASEEAEFSIYIQNTGASAASGQVVLQLNVQGSAATVNSSVIAGMPFTAVTPLYEPSKTACTEITFISNTITLAGGQSRAYTFTLNLEQVDSHWWIPALEIAQ